MGYQTEEIATINEPSKVSLTANPNFIEFKTLEAEDEDKYVNVVFEIVGLGLLLSESEASTKSLSSGLPDLSVILDPDWIDKWSPVYELEITEILHLAENQSSFTIHDVTNEKDYTFKGVAATQKDELDSTTFLLTNSMAEIAENIRVCLMKHPFFKGNYDITIPAEMEDGKPVNGKTIHITSKSAGRRFNFTIKDSNSVFIKVHSSSSGSASADSILLEAESCEIQLDVYKNTGVRLGAEDFDKTGTYITTLTKTYYGQPLWFDVNTIWANHNSYSDQFLSAGGEWCSPGTVNDFRFIAKKYNGMGYKVFYHSDVLYALSGYGRNLNKIDLSSYIYNLSDDNKVQPLTKQLELTHIRGQKQYFNFILSNPETDEGLQNDELGILYKVYTQSGSFLENVIDKTQAISSFEVANTIRLDIDSVLDQYPKTGIVKVYLSRNGKPKSKPLVFSILPDCLYKVNDFAFLNSLGGWSSFNFGGAGQTDFKADAATIYKTQTPQHQTYSQIESVFSKEVSEQFVVQTAPIKTDVADWLKELSTSVAVYELSTGRYVVLDELNVKHNSKDDLFTLQMKYHYSDSYNAGLK